MEWTLCRSTTLTRDDLDLGPPYPRYVSGFIPEPLLLQGLHTIATTTSNYIALLDSEQKELGLSREEILYSIQELYIISIDMLFSREGPPSGTSSVLFLVDCIWKLSKNWELGFPLLNNFINTK